MSECSLQDPFDPDPEDINQVIFDSDLTTIASKTANHFQPANHCTPSITKSDRKRPRNHDGNFSLDPPAMFLSRGSERTPTPKSFKPVYHQMVSFAPSLASQTAIPKRIAFEVVPFDHSTHAQDKKEFEPIRCTTKNVASEYSGLVGNGSKSSTTRLSDALEQGRQQKRDMLSSSYVRPSPRHNMLSRTAPALGTLMKSKKQRQRDGTFLAKKVIASSKIITKSGSDGFLTKSKPPLSTIEIPVSPVLRSFPPRHRPGSTVDNPVELSDDDEVEVEERELEQEWDGLSTDIAIGQIWIGRYRLVCHGPARLRLDLTYNTDQKNLTIEFTPYMIEKISVRDIVTTKLYSRMSGGCTFLSILVSQRHDWGRWSQQYKFRQSRSDPVWITMFFGASSQRESLESTARDLPSYEEVLCPSDHLDVVGRDLLEQYPTRTARLDVESQSNRKKFKNQVICRYPLGSRDGVTIRNGDLESLDPHEFLNDTVIDFKLAHLRLNDFQPTLNYHVFSSFFYKRFVTSNMSYDSVKRWTDKLDLFRKDFWLIPICESLHWTLAVVCYPNATVSDDKPPVMLYYDSLRGSGKKAFAVIQKYIAAALMQPARLKRMETMLKIECEFQLIDVEAPMQMNSYDCGIYLLLFAQYFLKSPPADVCSPHEPDWFDRSVADAHRNKIRDEILRIAYSQTPGHPQPVSTQYNVGELTYINDDDWDMPAITINNGSVDSVEDVAEIVLEGQTG